MGKRERSATVSCAQYDIAVSRFSLQTARTSRSNESHDSPPRSPCSPPISSVICRNCSLPSPPCLIPGNQVHVGIDHQPLFLPFFLSASDISRAQVTLFMQITCVLRASLAFFFFLLFPLNEDARSCVWCSLRWLIFLLADYFWRSCKKEMIELQAVKCEKWFWAQTKLL